MMTSLCLLTKTAAGVGLNLTHANFAIILEPSMDAHDEVQSICRVHRIGQTRPVTVLKLFMRGSIEERILKRRQQRGELSVSINAAAGGGGGGEDGDGDEDDGAGGAAESSAPPAGGGGAGKKKATKGKAAAGGAAASSSVSSSRSIKLDDLKLLIGI